MASVETAHKTGRTPHTPDRKATPVVIADKLSKPWSRNPPVRAGETLAERQRRVDAVRSKYAHLSGTHTDEFLEEKRQQIEVEYSRYP